MEASGNAAYVNDGSAGFPATGALLLFEEEYSVVSRHAFEEARVS